MNKWGFRVLRRHVGVIAIAAALALATQAAAAKTMAELHAAAKIEGVVTVLGPPTVSLRNLLVEGFAKAYPGINVEYSGMRTFQINAKFGAETKAGVNSTDIVISGPSTISQHRRPFEDLLIDPDAKDQSKWRDGKFDWADERRTALALVKGSSAVIMINTDLVKPGEVASDRDLLNPKWKGMITSGSPTVPGAAKIGMRRLYDLHGEDFVRRFAAQGLILTKDYREETDSIVKGRYAIGFAPDPGVASLFLEKGIKNLKLIGSDQWKDPTTFTPGFATLMVPTTVAHPAAAQLFLNWLLTKDGMQAVSLGQNSPSQRRDVAEDHTLPAVRQYPGKTYLNAFSDAYYAHPNEAKLLQLVKSLGM